MDVLRCLFDWHVFETASCSRDVYYDEGQIIVAAGSENSSVYWLLKGIARLESGVAASVGGEEKKNVLFGEIDANSPWPIFCEMSAMSVSGQQRASCSILAGVGGCHVRIIPTSTIFSYLFWSPSSQKSDYAPAVLFYESICRHYAAKLRSIHTRKLVSTSELRGGCLRVGGEGVVYTWACHLKRPTFSLKKCDVIVCLSKSYLAVVRSKYFLKGKGKGKEKEREKEKEIERETEKDTEAMNGSKEAKKIEICLIDDIQFIFDEKKLIKIQLKERTVTLHFTKESDQNTFLDVFRALHCPVLVQNQIISKSSDNIRRKKREKEKEKYLADATLESEKILANREVPRGLTEADFKKLSKMGTTEIIQKGKVICVQGLLVCFSFFFLFFFD
jgi:hypothetical protein